MWNKGNVYRLHVLFLHEICSVLFSFVSLTFVICYRREFYVFLIFIKITKFFSCIIIMDPCTVEIGLCTKTRRYDKLSKAYEAPIAEFRILVDKEV